MHMIPAFHPWLVEGVASYGLELLRAVPSLEVVYVPIGQGSGVNAVLAARAALGHGVTVVGVVSAHAPAYARSFEARAAIEAPTTTALADGLACRVPDADALAGSWPASTTSSRSPTPMSPGPSNMPGTGGAQLIAEARTQWPAMPIVAISGAAVIDGRPVADVARELGADEALVKPFRARQLAEAIERARAARKPAA